MTPEIRCAVDRYRALCSVQVRERALFEEESTDDEADKARRLFLTYGDALDALKEALRAIPDVPLGEVGDLVTEALRSLDAWEVEISEMVRCVTRRDDPFAIVEEGVELLRKMKQTRVGPDPGAAFFAALDALAERVPPMGVQA